MEQAESGLPAGRCDAEEDPRRAVERETLEETGLIVETVRLLDLLHRPDADGLADIVIAYSSASPAAFAGQRRR
jgi:ADP-ribose pyrophosphatase YjhB (NUDIX family)